MCSQADEPTGWSDDLVAPEPTAPRVYRLSGDKPPEPRESVALAVIGSMLSEAESIVSARPPFYQAVAAEVLREARDRIADAESRL